MTIAGMLVLMWVSAIYSAYGISAYPRQEWILEVLASVLFIIPVVNLLRVPKSLALAARLIGGMLILHTLWDALHWPDNPLINTPIDPWIPHFCPWIEIPLGSWLLIRGR